MRIVARAELHAFGKRYPDARASLESWIAVVECANWKKPAVVKLQRMFKFRVVLLGLVFKTMNSFDIFLR